MATFLFLHGWQGSDPEHWQRLTAAELAARGHAVRFPDFPEPDIPVLEPWLARLEEELAACEATETTVLAHSLGCYLWLHHAPVVETPVDRVLLVAPPAPSVCAAIEELSTVPLPASDPAAVARSARSTELVHGDDDPYWPDRDAGELASALDVPARRIPGGGHVNVASGYGHWPALLAWCEGAGAL